MRVLLKSDGSVVWDKKSRQGFLRPDWDALLMKIMKKVEELKREKAEEKINQTVILPSLK